MTEKETTTAEEVADAAAPATEGTSPPVSESLASAVELVSLIEKGKAAFAGLARADTPKLREDYALEISEVLEKLGTFADSVSALTEATNTAQRQGVDLRRDLDFASKTIGEIKKALETERRARAAAEDESQLSYEEFLNASQRAEELQVQQTIAVRRINSFSGRAERAEEALRNVRDGHCSCGGRYALVGSEVRCISCSRHEGYGVPQHWREKASEILAEAAQDVK